MSIPNDSQERKDIPLYSGCLAYFPLALAEVARLSRHGNDKHNPGEPLHWSRDKSSDHTDCIARHLLECGQVDGDGFLHDVKVAWRALANLQIALEGGYLKDPDKWVIKPGEARDWPIPKQSPEGKPWIDQPITWEQYIDRKDDDDDYCRVCLERRLQCTCANDEYVKGYHGA